VAGKVADADARTASRGRARRPRKGKVLPYDPIPNLAEFEGECRERGGDAVASGRDVATEAAGDRGDGGYFSEDGGSDVGDDESGATPTDGYCSPEDDGEGDCEADDGESGCASKSAWSCDGDSDAGSECSSGGESPLPRAGPGALLGHSTKPSARAVYAGPEMWEEDEDFE
jgi:hypothetical protein